MEDIPKAGSELFLTFRTTILITIPSTIEKVSLENTQYLIESALIKDDVGEWMSPDNRYTISLNKSYDNWYSVELSPGTYSVKGVGIDFQLANIFQRNSLFFSKELFSIVTN